MSCFCTIYLDLFPVYLPYISPQATFPRMPNALQVQELLLLLLVSAFEALTSKVLLFHSSTLKPVWNRNGKQFMITDVVFSFASTKDLFGFLWSIPQVCWKSISYGMVTIRCQMGRTNMKIESSSDSFIVFFLCCTWNVILWEPKILSFGKMEIKPTFNCWLPSSVKIHMYTTTEFVNQPSFPIIDYRACNCGPGWELVSWWLLLKPHCCLPIYM